MRQFYGAGEKAFVDYAGSKFQVVDRRSTGEVRDAMVFDFEELVAALLRSMGY